MRDPGSIPKLGRSPGEGNGNPLQYSCLENPMDGGTWWQSMGSQRVGHDWAASLSLSFSRIEVRLFLCQHLSETCSKGYWKLHLSVTFSASLLCFFSSLSDAPAFQPLFMSCLQTIFFPTPWPTLTTGLLYTVCDLISFLFLQLMAVLRVTFLEQWGALIG